MEQRSSTPRLGCGTSHATFASLATTSTAFHSMAGLATPPRNPEAEAPLAPVASPRLQNCSDESGYDCEFHRQCCYPAVQLSILPASERKLIRRPHFPSRNHVRRITEIQEAT